jgi:hypothetical protein
MGLKPTCFTRQQCLRSRLRRSGSPVSPNTIDSLDYRATDSRLTRAGRRVPAVAFAWLAHDRDAALSSISHSLLNVSSHDGLEFGACPPE